MSAPLVVRAFAKINLTLRVLGTRPDGYHDLRTTLQTLALHDTLVFSPSRGTTPRGAVPLAIACDDPEVPTDRTNLVWKAADAMSRWAGRSRRLPPVEVRLIKQIPPQSGLGGGSSDAAAALRALARLWDLKVPGAELHAIARSLGADVPFFLSGGTALGVDRGEVLFALEDYPRTWVVVARPSFGVSTAAAYRWWDEGRPQPSGRIATTAQPLPASECRNDLEAPVVARHPEIGRLVKRLRRLDAEYAAMSGSGSAVFGLFGDKTMAVAAADALRAAGAATVVTRSLTRREFRRLSEPHNAARRGRRQN